MFDLKAYPNASLERQENTTHVVSAWYIPNSSDYDKASAIYVYFSALNEAFDFSKKYSMPPEMAMVLTIEQHDEIQRLVAAEEKRRQEQEALYA